MLDFLAAQGYELTAATLEYWRGQRALPARLAPGRGQGRGRGSEDPPEAKAIALGICRWLDKKNGIADRSDLPRRRRVADAPLWLWYEGCEIPISTVRRIVVDVYSGLAQRLAFRRRSAARREPDAADYELPIAAAEAELREADRRHPVARGQLRAFRRLYRNLAPARAQELATSASAQLLAALQGSPDPEPEIFASGIEYPLIAAGVIDERTIGPEQVDGLARRLSIDRILTATNGLTEQDWQDVRAVLRGINAAIDELARHRNPGIRLAAKLLPRLNNSTSLAAAAGAAGANLDVLRGVREAHR